MYDIFLCSGRSYCLFKLKPFYAGCKLIQTSKDSRSAKQRPARVLCGSNRVETLDWLCIYLESQLADIIGVYQGPHFTSAVLETHLRIFSVEKATGISMSAL